MRLQQVAGRHGESATATEEQPIKGGQSVGQPSGWRGEVGLLILRDARPPPDRSAQLARF